jgi:hypothetical protein
MEYESPEHKHQFSMIHADYLPIQFFHWSEIACHDEAVSHKRTKGLNKPIWLVCLNQD